LLQSNDELRQAEAGLAAFQDRAAALGAEVAQAEAVGSSIQQSLVAGRLEGRRLVLVVAPGVPTEVVAGTRTVVEQAGGVWTGTVTLTEQFLDAGRATTLDDLALRLAPTEVVFPANAAPGARRNAALAASLVKPGDPATSPSAAGYLAALQQVDAVAVQGSPQARAALAVMLVPPGPPGPTSETLISLSTALGAAGGAAVATPGGAASSATLTVLRTTTPPPPKVSTVDGAARVWGRIGLVNAASAAFGGSFGAYGPEAVLSSAAAGGSTPSPTPTG
jgi:hypothetical protein